MIEMQHMSGTCLWLNAMGWELHVLLGRRKSNHRVFIWLNSHCLHLHAFPGCSLWRNTERGLCYAARPARHCSQCVNSCVCLVEVEEEDFQRHHWAVQGITVPRYIWSQKLFGLCSLKSNICFLCQCILIFSSQQ